MRRARVQLPQLQFHWGKPPPAAEPRTLIFMRGGADRECRAGRRGRWQTGGNAEVRRMPAGTPALSWPGMGRERPVRRSAVEHVHRDFKAETQVDGRRGFPFHDL